MTHLKNFFQIKERFVYSFTDIYLQRILGNAILICPIRNTSGIFSKSCSITYKAWYQMNCIMFSCLVYSLFSISGWVGVWVCLCVSVGDGGWGWGVYFLCDGHIQPLLENAICIIELVFRIFLFQVALLISYVIPIICLHLWLGWYCSMWHCFSP